MILLMLACSGPPEPEASDTGEAGSAAPPVVVTPLSAPRLLRRMSLDLLGVVPSVADLDAVEADPTQLDTLRDRYLDDPRLETRLVYLLAERWDTRIDSFNVGVADYYLRNEDTERFVRAVGEEPLRLAAHVVVTDAPWNEVVEADYTMADELLASIWPLDREAGEGWQVARYTDGRPAAGVLATNGLWWRYTTTRFNYNRSRAAAITRSFLCEDLLDRPVTFGAVPALLDEDGTNVATRTDPACLACHVSLDPIAAATFGFWWFDSYDVSEMTTYHPDREPLYADYLQVDPAWFGTPIAGLNELGPWLGQDPRFARCGVQTFAEALWRRREEPADYATIEAMRQEFVAGGLTVRPLLRTITDGPTYRAGGLTAEADTAAEARESTARMLAPDQLASAVADLTGFVWTWGDWHLMDNDLTGYRVMAGGLDGVETTRPATRPSLTYALTQSRLAEGAAAYVAAADAAGDTALLSLVDPSTRPGDPAFAAQLDELYWHLYAERPDPAWTEAATTLWQTVEAADGATAAWAAVLTAMLRDPLWVSE